jgi:hypothetical protein
VLVEKLMAELAKPPKPFKPTILTKAQKKAYDKARRAMLAGGPAMPTPRVAVPM